MTEDLEISDYACVGDILQVSPLTFYRYNINPTKKKITLLDDDVDEKIHPYINVTGIITKFDTEDVTISYIVIYGLSFSFNIAFMLCASSIISTCHCA